MIYNLTVLFCQRITYKNVKLVFSQFGSCMTCSPQKKFGYFAQIPLEEKKSGV